MTAPSYHTPVGVLPAPGMARSAAPKIDPASSMYPKIMHY